MIAMKTNKQKIVALSLAAITAVSSPLPAYADLEGVMESAFNSEMNVTPAGAYMGARRGAVSFGRVRIANKISNPQLITFTPPGIKAGCGGIDIWGGSFGFISGKQLEALAKNIASNAAGYAFELALSKFPDGKDAIGKIRTLISWANKASLDSCAIARSMVDGVFKANEQATNDAGIVASMQGSTKDFFSAMWSGESPLSKVSLGKLMEQTGFRPNPIWSAITETGAYSWFPSGGGNTFAEAMMSLTGAVILKKDGSKDANDQEVLKPIFQSPTLDIHDLVKGGSVQVLHCNNEQCDDINTDSINLKGFHWRIYNALAKDGGIIDKFYFGNTDFTDDEKKMLQSLRPNIGWALNDLSRNPGAAREFSSVVSEVAAYNTACDLGREIVNVMEIAMRAKTVVGKEDVVARVEASKQALRDACTGIKDRVAETQTAVQLHNQFMALIKTKG